MPKQNTRRFHLTPIADYLVATFETLKSVIPTPAAFFASWIVFCYLLTLPQPWRAVTIWTELVLLCVGSVVGDPLRRR